MLRRTSQRGAILEALRGTHRHPTAAELHCVVRRRLPRISLGTVYRNLEVLARAGLVQRLGAAGAEMRFDARVEPHNHVRCVRCGRMCDLELVEQPVELSAARRTTGFEILSASLEFRGLCPECGRSRASVGRDPAASLKMMQSISTRRKSR